MKTFYLRQHGWCHCQHSFNTAKNFFEAGVSVYECKHVEGTKWRGVGPGFQKRERVFQGQQRRLLGGVNTCWYLVMGEHVGTGADQEPLLRNLIAHKIVKWDGENYFVEVSVADKEVWSDHNGFPDCRCQSIDDLLAQT